MILIWLTRQLAWITMQIADHFASEAARAKVRYADRRQMRAALANYRRAYREASTSERAGMRVIWNAGCWRQWGNDLTKEDVKDLRMQSWRALQTKERRGPVGFFS